MSHRYFVYIIANKRASVFYIGVTSHLVERMKQHKNLSVDGFSKRYRLTCLVYYEEFGYIDCAFSREKQLKNWHRKWKVNLIRQSNLKFDDLSEAWV